MSKPPAIQLCPAQKRAFEGLQAGIQVGSILRLFGGIGRGKTTVLREFHRQAGGAFINLKEFVEASATKHPLALEETLYHLVMDALKANPLVIVDDVHLLDLYSAGCHFYPRSGYFNSIMMGLCTYTLEAKKKLVFGTKDHLAEAADQRSYSFGIDKFKTEDYAALVGIFRGAPTPKLDFEKIFRFAPKLNAHQLKAACQWLGHSKNLTTDQLIEYLRSQRLASNVDLGEVQEVDLKDLKGVDDVLRSLEINIVLPLTPPGPRTSRCRDRRFHRRRPQSVGRGWQSNLRLRPGQRPGTRARDRVFPARAHYCAAEQTTLCSGRGPRLDAAEVSLLRHDEFFCGRQSLPAELGR